MGPLLLGVALLLVILMLLRGFAFADPRALARVLRYTGAGALGVFTLLLFFTGRIAPAFVLGSMAWGLATGGHVWPLSWPPHFPGTGTWRSKPAAGGSTAVRTAWLEMELDHDSGEMHGTVVKGTHSGSRLDQLPREQALALYIEAATDDPESGRLLEAYLDRRFGAEWRADFAEGHSPKSTRTGMSRQEALKVLGLHEGATEEAIRAAHRRLMLQNHPDRGGSDYLAAKINEAKSALLDN
jgi:DnaJ-like protein